MESELFFEIMTGTPMYEDEGHLTEDISVLSRFDKVDLELVGESDYRYKCKAGNVQQGIDEEDLVHLRNRGWTIEKINGEDFFIKSII